MQRVSRACLVGRLMLALLGSLLAIPAANAEERPAYVVLVTLDGYRWQELFHGADPALVTRQSYRARYIDVPDRAQALTPFLLSFAQQGALIGDRDAGSCARVANEYWFSYPGYAEMLSGRPNPNARSNRAIPNQDVTVLERLARRTAFAGQVQVYAEWNAVPSILNVARSHIPVFTPPDEAAAHDPQVMGAARTVFASLPRVTWIALGDTDNRAHEGDYEAYLSAATDADNYLRELWDAIESDPRTAGQTTLIVTADHGRGGSEGGRWRGHGSGHWRGIIVPGLRHEGSDAIFIGVRGPGVVSTHAYTMENCATVGQVAATVLNSLHVLAEEGQPDMAPPLDVFDPVIGGRPAPVGN